MAAHPALTFVEKESQTIGGFGRNDHFSYTQHFGGTGEVANRVLLEAGTASGREPTTVVELSSYLGQFLKGRGMSLGAEDEAPFSLRLLHFRRTFVEKLFAIHAKVELLKRDGQPLELTPGTTTTCSNWLDKRKWPPCCIQANMRTSKPTTTGSAGSTLRGIISIPIR